MNSDRPGHRLDAVTWAEVVAHYDVGDPVPPLVGSARLTVAALDDQRICFRQPLWTACLNREDFEFAVELLSHIDPPKSPVAFSELLRRSLAARTARVDTGCSRIPNLCALVCRDLRLVASAAPRRRSDSCL